MTNAASNPRPNADILAEPPAADAQPVDATPADVPHSGARGAGEPNVVAALVDSGMHASLAKQFQWSLRGMGLRVAEQDARGLRLEPEPAARPGKPADSHGAADPRVPAVPVEVALDESSLVQWMRMVHQAQAHEGSGAWEGEPDGEPATIREIAGPLLRPYIVRQGQVRLAGCMLEERPALRIASLHCAAGGPGAGGQHAEIRYRYFGPDGSPLPLEEAEVRGFSHVHPVRRRLRSSDRESIENWRSVAQSMLETTGQAEAIGPRVDVTVLWSRWASGKIVIQFDSGPSSSLAFEGWARDFASGRIHPPRFQCPTTGDQSYEVVALEDGTITTHASVGSCEITGREMFNDQLATCEISGQRADRTLMERCASTGAWGLEDRMGRCQWCGGTVMPAVLQQDVCDRCRNRRPIDPQNPAVQQLVRSHPRAAARLGRPARWTGWADDQRAVIVGGGWWNQRLVVYDVADDVLIRSGRRSRLGSLWKLDEAM